MEFQKPKIKQIKVRLDEETYNLLVALTKQRGESISYYARKIIERDVKNEAALNAQDQLVTALRKALRLEMREFENRIANLAAKAAIAAATAENLSYLLIKNQGLQNPQEVKNLARKRAVAYLRENLEDILDSIEEGEG